MYFLPNVLLLFKITMKHKLLEKLPCENTTLDTIKFKNHYTQQHPRSQELTTYKGTYHQPYFIEMSFALAVHLKTESVHMLL